jgi:hypothetical protein
MDLMFLEKCSLLLLEAGEGEIPRVFLKGNWEKLGVGPFG